MTIILVLIALYLWWTVESVLDIISVRRFNKDLPFRWMHKSYKGYTSIWIWLTSLAIFAICVSDLYKYFNK